jgi:hypothetical protein
MKQSTGAKYKKMVKVWLAALSHLLKGHCNYCKFSNPVTDCILIASYHSQTETTLKYLQDELSGISSNIHLFYHTAKAIVWTRYPIFIPFSNISNV